MKTLVFESNAPTGTQRISTTEDFIFTVDLSGEHSYTRFTSVTNPLNGQHVFFLYVDDPDCKGSRVCQTLAEFKNGRLWLTKSVMMPTPGPDPSHTLSFQLIATVEEVKDVTFTFKSRTAPEPPWFRLRILEEEACVVQMHRPYSEPVLDPPREVCAN
jgi:hypothetical protein